MADDDKAKSDFNDILNSIERKFEIIHAKWTENRNFEVKFRTSIQRNNEDFNGLCDEWVDLFSEVTSTVWAKKISNTGPKIRFRKQYQCWTHAGKVVQKELLFDAKRCKATLDMKVLTDNPLTRRKNKHIRMGLNVVVKINFNHLHPVETNTPFAFFVHSCEPQQEAPKQPISSNERLPQLVAEMVQKGLFKNKQNQNNIELKRLESEANNNNNTGQNVVTQFILEDPKLVEEATQDLREAIPEQEQSHTIQLIPNVPLANIETLKFEVHPVQPQFTQVVVSGPQLDMSEHLLMCQPLMFDTSQVIPISSHNLPSHFVQVNNLNNSQVQFL